MLPEQELPVQVADVNGVHVDDVDVFEAHEGQILEEFTTEASGSNDKYFTSTLQKCQRVWRRLKTRVSKWTPTLEKFSNVIPVSGP